MGMPWRQLAAALVGLAVCGGGDAAAAPAAAPPAAQAEVVKAVDAFVETLNTADLDSFAGFFTPDATVFFPLEPVIGLLDGKPEILKVFTIFFASVRKEGGGPRYMDLKPEGLKVQLYGETAVATFHFSGKTMFSRRTLVLHREGGRWLVVHMHASGLPLQAR